MQITEKIRKGFWQPGPNCFFGDFYILGDNSQAGYLSGKNQNLHERTVEEVEGILQLTQTKYGVILDIPCGYGRHSNLLAEKGFKVVGVDINNQHLSKAHNSYMSTENRPTYFEMNMIDFCQPNTFSLAINMFYSFGFFVKDSDNEKCLKNIYASLQQTGKLLFHTDVNMDYVYSGNYKFKEERKLPKSRKLIIDENYVEETKRMEGSWTLLSKFGKEIATRGYSMRVYSKKELKLLFEKVGFKNIQIFGNWQGGRCTKKSEMMIIIGEK